MSYRARNGKVYPYKEMSWQYKERKQAESSGGCLEFLMGLALVACAWELISLLFF